LAQAAVRIAGKIGLLRTMVFSHLPSNLLLIAVAFAPDLASAIALLLARFALSQMDVPTRQAYVMGVVDPSERTAAAYTNTARYLTRPSPPLSPAPPSAARSERPSSSPEHSNARTTAASTSSSVTSGSVTIVCATRPSTCAQSLLRRPQ
jgi:hypothetical protein